MKRKSFVLCLSLSLLVLSGCGNSKTLNCTMSANENGYKGETKVNFKVSGKKMKSMNMELNYSASDKADTEATEAIGYISTMMDAIKEEANKTKGVKISSKLKGNNYELKMNIDYDKINTDELNNLNLDPSEVEDIEDVNVEELKKDLESKGFTCKQ